MPHVDFDDKQGGKAYGELRKHQEEVLDEINKSILEDEKRPDIENLEEKLESFKEKYMEFDLDDSGDIGEMQLKQMLEKLGQAKTHKEVKKMIAEVDTRQKGAICYRDFLDMMLGLRKSVLRMILLFEGIAKEEAEKPTGPPPKRDISSLP